MTQEMCNGVVKVDPWQQEYVPDSLKMQGMCIRAVEADLGLLKYVPDWFVTQQQIKTWHDDAYYCNNNEMIEWYDGYKKQKA